MFRLGLRGWVDDLLRHRRCFLHLGDVLARTGLLNTLICSQAGLGLFSAHGIGGGFLGQDLLDLPLGDGDQAFDGLGRE